MHKLDFAINLAEKLSFLPQEEIEERVSYYVELIDDRMEDGLSEVDAVAAVGSIDEIVAQIIADTPFSKIAKEKLKSKKRLGAGTITLLVLGSPVWLSLCIAAFAVVLSVYISLWSVIISLWAAFVSVAACSVAGALSCIVFIAQGKSAASIAILAAGTVCAGLSIFLFYGCKIATKGMILLTKQMALWVKNCFVKKEVA